jgi:hypothetical protein
MMLLVAENLKQYSGGVASGGNYIKFYWNQLMLSIRYQGWPEHGLFEPTFSYEGESRLLKLVESLGILNTT